MGRMGGDFVKDRGGDDFLWENFGFGLIPAATEGGKSVTLTHPLAYMVSSKSEHPDLAFKLISAVTNDEANTRHAIGSTHLGILKSQATYAPYLEDRLLTEVLYMLEFTTFIPNNPNWGVYDSIWFEGMLGASTLLRLPIPKYFCLPASSLQALMIGSFG